MKDKKKNLTAQELEDVLYHEYWQDYLKKYTKKHKKEQNNGYGIKKHYKR